jgi:hypothetical protein
MIHLSIGVAVPAIVWRRFPGRSWKIPHLGWGLCDTAGLAYLCSSAK